MQNNNNKVEKSNTKIERKQEKSRRAQTKDTIAPMPLLPVLPPFLFPLLLLLLLLLFLLLPPSVCHALPPINIDWKSIGFSNLPPFISLSLCLSLSSVLMSFAACVEALRAVPLPFTLSPTLPHKTYVNICCACVQLYTHTHTHSGTDMHVHACVLLALTSSAW